MDRRRTALIATGLVVAGLLIDHPTADIQVLTHDQADRSPRRFQAAVDLGLAGVSVLVTWTGERLIR